ncbi:MAG: hypothetical protein COA99_17550 [Moraxellaceae bacterium]|nr:MAG: hypothetical protein COA99_17550 [Moraxellaceae bacterium]
MQEYKYLKDALREFSSTLELGMEEYLSEFRKMIEVSPDYAKCVRAEILLSLSDPGWDWVEEAEKAEFIGSDDNVDSVWETVVELIWKVVAPNEEVPNIKD